MQANDFVWYELTTTDQKAAEAFYRDVMGWDMADAGMPGFAYTILSANGARVGGLMGIPSETTERRAGWIGHIGVADVDAMAARVTEAGGAIHRPPTDIPGIGRFAVVADPHGAVFILFQPNPGHTPQPVPPMTPGHAGWHELQAGDRETAFAFYERLFGWTRHTAIGMGPMGIYQTFAANGVQIGGMMTKMESAPTPFWLYYFNVADIDAAAARVKHAKGHVLHGPQQVPGDGWIVQCRDPQGAMFALVGPKA